LYLHLQGQSVQDDLQDEVNRILQYVGNFSLIDMVPHPTRLEFSVSYLFDVKNAETMEETLVW